MNLFSWLGKKTLQSQGVFDIVRSLDQETLDKIKAIIHSIDEEKIKQVLKTIETDEEGWLRIKIDLGVHK